MTDDQKSEWVNGPATMSAEASGQRPESFADRVENKARQVYAAYKGIAQDLRLDEEANFRCEAFSQFCREMGELGVLLNMNVN